MKRRPAAHLRTRSFGVTFSAIAALIAAWFVWRGAAVGAGAAAATAITLLVVTFSRLHWLTVPSDLWWRFSKALGWVNVRILLGILFFVILAPVGTIRRLAGRDPLRRRRGSAAWVPYPPRYRDPKHFERQF